MGKDTGQEVIGRLGESLLPFRVVKYIFPVLIQGHIGVHAGAGLSEDGLRHKGGVQAVLLGDDFDRHFKGHDVVGRFERVGVFKVDLVLAGRHLVVGGLDFKAHVFQRDADFSSGGLAMIQRPQIKIARLVVGLGGGLTRVVGLKQEELAFGADVKGVKPHVCCFFERTFEYVARISHKRGTVCIVYVTDEAGGLAVRALLPWEYREGIQVRVEVLVGLVDADKPLDGRTVKHDLIV
ncbi:hypothetical protein SDC9_137551 [bioreactor metagenome]|uniref:Uncharacterized protein n=1 Tax=bioreactor metagenome TaxID=1076179 RepID=A0A645DLV6_9ZZZZ